MRRREFDDEDEDEDGDEAAATAGGGLRGIPLIQVPGVRETTFLCTFEEEKGSLLRGKARPLLLVKIFILLVTPTPPQRQHSTIAGIIR